MIRTAPFTKTYENFCLCMPELTFPDHSITALIGPNGCGKSTLGKCLSGVLKTDSNISPGSFSTGYAPQTAYPFRMSLKKNVLLNCNDSKKADRLIEAMGLSDLAGQNARKLSVGQTERMALARILAGSYDLLILDEPTASMDKKSTLLAEGCIRDYANTVGSVLLITHSLAQAGRIADHIIFMDQGRIVEMGPAADLLEHPRQEQTREFLRFSNI